MAKIAILHGKTNPTSLCKKDGMEYQRLIKWGLEPIAEFDSAYWAHKWLKENGYEKTGYYVRDCEPIETYRLKSEIR